MKTNSSIRKNSHCKVNIILGQLTSRTLNKIARTKGYIQRKSFSICPKSFIVGFMLMVSKQRNTYADWATEIGLLEGRSITKQALNERMRPQTEMFVRQVVGETISKQVSLKPSQKSNGLLRHFGNVMIDDSTTLCLPDVLAGTFPGNVSKGVQKAQAKIHAMYNMTENNFVFLNLHSFSNNDQSLSPNVIPYLKEGDLCLRDLGFTILETISEFVDKGIYFIARKGYAAKVYDVDTKKELDLLKELRKNKFIDKQVLIGKKKRIKLRLIALEVPHVQAAIRRRKAKADRDRRLNHSLEYYELLGYSIYITNITTIQCNAEEIFQLYKLRWRIEIIFKSWKSCFSIEKIIHQQCTNAIRVKCIIYLMLLYIYLFHVVWWKHCEDKIKTGSEQIELSILKLANFFKNQFTQIIISKSDRQIIKQILTHCCYDKRNDRVNSKQLYLKMAA
jgi:hypothetical protein